MNSTNDDLPPMPLGTLMGRVSIYGLIVKCRVHDDNALQAYAREAVAARWVAVTERLPEPGMYVLVACARRVLRALHAPRFTLSEDEWGEFDTGADYDEATDMSYWPEGWYEVNQHEETHWQLDSDPTHWMPLPPLPKEQTSWSK